MQISDGDCNLYALVLKCLRIGSRGVLRTSHKCLICCGGAGLRALNAPCVFIYAMASVYDARILCQRAQTFSCFAYSPGDWTKLFMKFISARYARTKGVEMLMNSLVNCLRFCRFVWLLTTYFELDYGKI